MTPPVPVPSKAAIRALRGLAFGTSCAIGVIVEDRRRRISTLQTAISNKERLLAARQYRSTPQEAASWLPYDEEAVALRFESTPHDRPLATGKVLPDRLVDHLEHQFALQAGSKDGQEAGWNVDTAQQQDGGTTRSSRRPNSRLKYFEAFTPPSTDPLPPGNLPSRPWGRSTSTLAQPKDLPTMIETIEFDLANKSDETSIDRAVAEYLRGSRLANAYAANGPAWRRLSALLARECHRRGRSGQALSILKVALAPGAINEAEYFDHDPFSIIESMIADATARTDRSRADLLTAVQLFTAKFTDKPQMHDEDVLALGRKLITAALALDDPTRAIAVYWRLIPHVKGSDFLGWFIRSLYNYGDFRGVVKYFLLSYSKTSPGHQCFQDTSTCVVHAVERMRGAKAELVLRALASMRGAADGTLRSSWIMRLLHSHWDRHEDFNLSRELFEEIRAQGLLERIAHPQGSYRAIIAFALRAGEDEHARVYNEEAVKAHPSLRTDIPIQGYFALRKAQTGDWAATEEIFDTMRRSTAYAQQREEYSRAFVPILKEYADRNLAPDVRAFLDRYTKELAVEVDSWMMSVVANKYGEDNDMEAFISWLESCLESGVAVDASFCNVVLDNCRTRWQMPYPRLKKLADRMKELHPKSFNAVTRRILRASASISSTGAPQRIPSKELAVGKLALAGRSSNPYAVYDAMNHNLANNKPALALSLYKRAISFGMLHSERCLRLAVVACFKRDRLEVEAFPLIEAAHKGGHPVGWAVTVFLKHELGRVRGTPDVVIGHMQETIKKFQTLNIDFDPEAFTNTAITCIKLGQHDQASMMCKLAMERAGTSNPCFSRTSFRAWLMIYTQTSNVEGLTELVKALLASEYAAERNTLQQIKSASRLVRGAYSHHRGSAEIAAILQGGIESVKALRVNNAESGATISAETLRIMSDAVSQYEGSKETEANQPTDKFYMMRLRLNGDTEKLGYRVPGGASPARGRKKQRDSESKLPDVQHHGESNDSPSDSGGYKAAAAAPY
ncbi:pentatricopeptide repeat-containing protein PET309 [Microdochium nivale]|nr:pentatricopeptide repeat-containing protein PET309 [Microdochium nivale]